MPAAMIRIIEDLYAGCTTTVRASEGETDPIPMVAGVKQGCPLSPIIFNLAIEPIIRAALSKAEQDGAVIHRHHVAALAYADDLLAVGKDTECLQRLLHGVGQAATWAGLSFKPSKCASLHIDCRRRRRVLPTLFTIQGGHPHVLQDGEAYLHLGIPTGFRVQQTPDEDIAAMSADVSTLNESLLAPWQKLDVLRTFLQPRLDFILRGGAVSKGPLKLLDSKVKACAKSWMNLPQRASAEPLYLPMKEGGAGLLPFADVVEVLTLVQGFRLLHCRDPLVADIAQGSLLRVVRRRIGRAPSQEDLATYLSGSLEGEFRRDGGDISSLWTQVRNSSRRLKARTGVCWRWSEALQELQVVVPRGDDGRIDGEAGDEGDNPLGQDAAELEVRVPPDAKQQLARVLKASLHSAYRRRLLRKPDQGKVFEVTGLRPASNHFMEGGKFTRFADWRFIHRARLDVLPLNGARRFDGGPADVRCRRCQHAKETLPHVLNHCLVHSAAWKRRHNAILERLVVAVDGRPRAAGEEPPEVRVDRCLPGDNSGLRPDLVVLDNARKKASIVDVTVAFENRLAAFRTARLGKILKYSPLAEVLRNRGFTVTVDAFVVGSLGGWDPSNEPVLRDLQIGRRYCDLLRRLMVSDTIRWSRDIYVEHVTGHRQYQ